MREISRRSAILAGGATVTGIGVLSLSSENASASISANNLSIEDETHVLTDDEIQDVRLTVDAEWSVQANAEVEAYSVELYLGSTAENADLIAYTDEENQGLTDTNGIETLNGSVLSSSSFDLDNFNPENGELITDIVVVLRFEAYRNDELVAEAETVEDATVTVRNEELDVNVSIGGEGELEFS